MPLFVPVAGFLAGHPNEVYRSERKIGEKTVENYEIENYLFD